MYKQVYQYQCSFTNLNYYNKYLYRWLPISSTLDSERTHHHLTPICDENQMRKSGSEKTAECRDLNIFHALFINSELQVFNTNKQ